MATQEYILAQSTNYYMGLMNIVSLLRKRAAIIEDVFGIYFPDLITSWILPWNNVISPIIRNFGLAKMINNAFPDKPSTQGDGSVTPWTIDSSQAAAQGMYNNLNDAGVTFNTDQSIDATFDILTSDPATYQLKYLRARTVMTSYETIHEIENTIYVILFAISPTQNVDNSITKSPGQLMTVSGDVLNDPYFIDIYGNGFAEVMWSSTDLVLTDIFSETYLTNNIFRLELAAPTHSIITKSSKLAYASGGTVYPIDIAEAGKIAIACIGVKLVGIDAVDNPVVTYPVVTAQSSAVGVISLDATTLYIGENLLAGFKDPSDVTYTLDLVYYHTL